VSGRRRKARAIAAAAGWVALYGVAAGLCGEDGVNWVRKTARKRHGR